MKKITKIGLIIGASIIALVIAGFLLQQGANWAQKDGARGGFLVPNNPSMSVATSGRMAIGAGLDVQLVSTTSRRASLEITNDCTSVVYLTMNDDAPLNTGLRLNANGGSFTMDTNNIYTGAIRATSSASCNLDLVEKTY
jgi:hypothetical protein